MVVTLDSFGNNTERVNLISRNDEITDCDNVNYNVYYGPACNMCGVHI